MRWLHENSSLPSVVHCGRSLLHGEHSARIVLDPSTSRTRFTGVKRCKSVHACPCCAPKIWRDRADELVHIVDAARTQGMTAAMLTLTLSHQRSDELEDLLGALRTGWKAVLDHSSVRDAQKAIGWHGAARRTEVTFGANGAHPHLHLLVFGEAEATDPAWQDFQAAVLKAWRVHAEYRGLRAPSAKRGVDLMLLNLERVKSLEAVSNYMTAGATFSNISAEMTNDQAKQAKNGNRTVWQILDDAIETGSAHDKFLWNSYEQATKGHRPWALSPSLKKLAAEHVERVEEEQPDTHEVGSLTVHELHRLWAHPQTPYGLVKFLERRHRYAGTILGLDPEHALEDCRDYLERLLTDWGIRDPGRRKRRGANPGPPGVISGVPRTRRRGPAGHGR